MKKDVKRKAFIKWPLYMSVVLLIMSVVVYVIDPYAGYAAIATALLYTAIAVAAYVYSRPAVHKEMISFATQYGQIQKRLLKELSVPYVSEDCRQRLQAWKGCELIFPGAEPGRASSGGESGGNIGYPV